MSQERRLILTARHCIATSDGQIANQVDLHFTDPASERTAAAVFSSTASCVDHGRDADWALLAAKELPPWQTTELRLLDLQVAMQSRMSTYGFPSDEGDGLTRGLDFGGSIRTGGKTLVAIHDPTATGQAIAGLSGGPAVVEEEVIGLILRADVDQRGIATTGRMYVLPLAACDGLAEHVRIHDEPAFLEKTADALREGSGLADVIRNIFRQDHAPIEGISKPDLHLAMCVLLRRRLDVVPRVVAETGLRREHAYDIVKYAASQWYPRASAITAARHLAPPLARGLPPEAPRLSRVVAVGCHNNACAERFVRRAGFDLTRSTTWHEGRLDAWMAYDETEPLTERVRQELALQLGLQGDAAPEVVRRALQEFMADEDAVRSPVFFWVLLPEDTRDEDIEALRSQYPDLRIVVLGQPRPAELALTIELDRDEAGRQVAELDKVETKLKTRFGPQRQR